MKRGDVLTKKPISSVEIEIELAYKDVCRTYLEKHGCQMSPTKPGWYRVTFPDGTHEEERLGMSGLYTRHVYIVLPSKVEFTVVIASALNETQRTRISMGFPKEIFPK